MERIRMNCVYVFLFLLLIHHCVGPPTQQKHAGNSTDTEEKPRMDDLGLEYNRYLMEVVEALESDPEFRKKLEHAEEADFRSGKIAAELEFVNHNVRNKLDELKRTELQRLRDLVHQAEEIEKNEINPNHVNPGHVDHINPHTFESADLHKLITQVRKDLDEADKKRREEFKEYEMQKKFEQEQKIKVLDEEHKKEYLHELEEQKKKHQQHEPNLQLHHPGSKAQLEEVWEKTDHMEQQQFNPRTFFVMHDLNGDGYWDEEEVSALFVKELNKLYTPGAPEDDMKERHEEMERMREHVFKETDTNRDRLISYNEFLEQTKKQEFNKDEGWETLDSQPQFTQQEYEEFERRRMHEIQDLIDRGLIQPYAPGMMPPPPQGYAQHPGQFQQHPSAGAHPNQMPPQQYGQNVGYHPQQGVPQYHPQGVPVQHQQGVPNHHQQGLPVQHNVPVQQHQQGLPVQHQQGVPVQQHQQGAPVQQHQQGVPVQQQQGVPVQQQHQGVPVQQHQQGVPVQQGVPMQQHHQGVPVQQQQQGVPVQQQQQGSQHPQGVPQQGQYQANSQYQQGQYQYQAPPQKVAQPPQALRPNPVPGEQKPSAQQQQYYDSNQIPNQGQINQQPQVAGGQQHEPAQQQHQASPQQNQIDTGMNKNSIPKH